MQLALLGLVSALRLDGGDWSVVLDGVMGGKSTGDLTTDGGVVDFSGMLNTHGGGFASITQRVENDLTGFSGIVVDFETQDGGIAPVGWELQVQDTSEFSFAHAFANPVGDGSRMKAYLPLAHFGSGTKAGWDCHDCTMDWAQTRHVKIYMLYQHGPYHLRIHSVEAVTAPPAVLDAPPSLAMDGPAVKELVRQTIQTGAPVYDHGYPELCDAIYESAMRSIMAASGVPEELRGPACAGAAWEDPSPQLRAWALRRAMDRITGDSWLRYPSAVHGDWLEEPCEEPGLPATPPPTDEPAAEEPAADDPAAEVQVSTAGLDGGDAKGGWRVVVDGVMGGKSTGVVTTDGGVLDFSGMLNVQNGGFASITRRGTEDLTGFSGIVVDFETQNGGSRPVGWELQVQDASEFSFGHAFANPVGDGSRMQVYLPLQNFGPGETRCGGCEPDWGQLRQVKLYMLFQQGPYHLRVHSIRAATAPPAAPAMAVMAMSAVDVQGLLQSTIEHGAVAYDQGYPGVCDAMYMSALQSIAAARGVPAATRDAACAGLEWQSSSGTGAGARGAKMRAWAMRRAMDRIMGEEGHESRYPEAVRGAWLDDTCDEAALRVPMAEEAARKGIEGQPRMGAQLGAVEDSPVVLVLLVTVVSLVACVGVLLVTLAVLWRRATARKGQPREVTVGSAPAAALAGASVVTGRMVPDDKGKANVAAEGIPVGVA